MTATRLITSAHTRLATVWRVVNADGTVTWQAWTACHDRHAPFNDMMGTYIGLHSDGSATRVTIQPDGLERIHETMPPIGET